MQTKNKKEAPKSKVTPKAMTAKASPAKTVQKPTPPKAPLKASSATSKTAKKLEPKVKLAIETIKGKGDKKSDKLEIKATEVPAISAEEEEEEMELTEAAKASAGSAAEAGLAMAAATAGADTAAGSLKNFRHHPDIENFYRFIFENDLRYEALEIIDVIVADRTNPNKTVRVAAKH